METIHLDPEVLAWEARLSPGGVLLERNARVHRLLVHADALLAGVPSALQRADAVLALNRAVDRRLRALEEIYHLRKLPLTGHNGSTLSVLALLGVVRPRMHDQLNEIRNLVEHEDMDPPDSEVCRTLAEFVWYFLRTTERLTLLAPTLLELVPSGQEDDWPYFLEIFEVDWTLSASMSIRGRLASSLQAPTPVADGLTIYGTVSPAKDAAEDAGVIFVSGTVRGSRRALEVLTSRLLTS